MGPTDEQRHAIDTVLAGHDTAIRAYAGAGKTTTVADLAIKAWCQTIYLVFNSEAAKDAQRKMPSHVGAQTVHSMAYRAIGYQYAARLPAPQNKDPRARKFTNRDMARLLGLDKAWRCGRTVLSVANCARVAIDTVTRFCQSADEIVGPDHAPLPVGVPKECHEELASFAVPVAKRLWDDWSKPDGQLPGFSHDHYLKVFQLLHPQLNTDLLILDEAQDSNSVILHVINEQVGRCRLAIVGDAFQAIYEWRGSVNAMEHLRTDRTCHLTMSFRFGPAVAELANPVLHLLDSTQPPLRGNPDKSTEIRTTYGSEAPDAILARTDAAALEEMMLQQQARRSTHLVGGTAKLNQFCWGCVNLQQGKPSDHPWLGGFPSWRSLVDHVNNADEHPDQELKALTSLVCRIGAVPILDAMKACVKQNQADVACGTTHSAKGREWDRVRLAGDFPTEAEDMDAAELRLLYVALTRAREELDVSNLGATLDLVEQMTKAQEDDEPEPPPPPIKLMLPGRRAAAMVVKR